MNGARPHTGTHGYKYRETRLVLFYWGRQGGGAGQHQRLALPYQLPCLPSAMRTWKICPLNTRAPDLDVQPL